MKRIYQLHLGSSRLYWNKAVAIMRSQGAEWDDHRGGLTEGQVKPSDVEKILLAKVGSKRVGGLRYPEDCDTPAKKQQHAKAYIERRDRKINSFGAIREEFDRKIPRVEGVSPILIDAMLPTIRDFKTACSNATKFRAKDEFARQQPWYWDKQVKKITGVLSRAQEIPVTPHKLLPIVDEGFVSGKSRSARSRERARKAQVPWKRHQSGGLKKDALGFVKERPRQILLDALQKRLDEAKVNQAIANRGRQVPSLPQPVNNGECALSSAWLSAPINGNSSDLNQHISLFFPQILSSHINGNHTSRVGGPSAKKPQWALEHTC